MDKMFSSSGKAKQMDAPTEVKEYSVVVATGPLIKQTGLVSHQRR